ncbi:MAG: tyrosine-type recombinase/integrase [Terriglobia bacterium]
MSVFPRGRIFWYEFMFHGQRVRESTGSTSRTLAVRAERQRRHELEEGANHLKADKKPLLFSVGAKRYIEEHTPHWSESNVRIESYNAGHLTGFFGKLLLTDITPAHISRYQGQRISAGASPRTCNMEVGTLRAILRKARLWANIQPDVKMLRVSDDVGQALSHDEESTLLAECGKSRSRSLYPAVTLALSTAMRYSEIRLLKWKQVDFIGKRVWVGKSKTEHGEGRPIPMNDRAVQVMTMWAENFPNQQPQHYVFPTEKYGAAGDKFIPCVHSTDPTQPIGDWKEAWEAARERAELSCRFHDLRHTACTRMLESGTPLSVVATIMGWSPSTAVRMSRRYGHIGQAAQVEAVKALNGRACEDFSGVPTKVPTVSAGLQ